MPCWRRGRSEVAIGVQVASFVLDRGFSEFYRSSSVSLYCRTLVAVSTSVQIRHGRPRLFIPSIRYVCWSQGTAGLAVLRVVTELYMIVRDLFQLSWLISWLTTARHPSSLPVCPCHTTIARGSHLRTACGSVCDRDQNRIKRSKVFFRQIKRS